MRDAGPTMRAHHDQVDMLGPSIVDDLRQWITNPDNASRLEPLTLGERERGVQTLTGFVFRGR